MGTVDDGPASRKRPSTTAHVYPALASAPLELLLDAIADRVAERIEARLAREASDLHATAKNNPLGTARAFADAARRGDFPTFKRGREVAARWVDVVAYIEGRECKRKAPPRRAPAAPLDAHARRLAQLRQAGAVPGAAR